MNKRPHANSIAGLRFRSTRVTKPTSSLFQRSRSAAVRHRCGCSSPSLVAHNAARRPRKLPASAPRGSSTPRYRNEGRNLSVVHCFVFALRPAFHCSFRNTSVRCASGGSRTHVCDDRAPARPHQAANSHVWLLMSARRGRLSMSKRLALRPGLPFAIPRRWRTSRIAMQAMESVAPLNSNACCEGSQTRRGRAQTLNIVLKRAQDGGLRLVAETQTPHGSMRSALQDHHIILYRHAPSL